MIENLPESNAKLYKSLLAEFRPDWNVEITIEDYNLYKLGFVREIPCSLRIDVSDEEIDRLHDEIIEMEIDCCLYEESPSSDSAEAKKYIEKYEKLAPLEFLCHYLD